MAFIDPAAPRAFSPTDSAPVSDGQAQSTMSSIGHMDPSEGPDHEQNQRLIRWMDRPNIADDTSITQETLNDLGSKVKLEYEIDCDSRRDWVEKTRKSIDLAMQVSQEKTYPWPKAANVIYPLMTTAAIQFAARAYPAIVAGRDIAKGIVIGQDSGTPLLDQQGQPVMNPMTQQPMWRMPPGAKNQRAQRIGEHMSFQLLDEMKEWEAETDQLLHVLPITGCVFRKSYFDPGRGRNMSVMVSPLNAVVNYWAKSLELAPRITEEIRLYPLEIKEMERAGLFLEVQYTSESPSDEGKKQADARDEDAPRDFLEQHRWCDLDEDGFPEPYIVTIHKSSQQVVRIKARYEADGIHVSSKDHKIKRIDPIHYYTKYDFLPNPDGGIYGLGFGQLLKPINEAINTTLNLMIDAGHLQNVGGGFIGKGLSMNTGAVRFLPGEYKQVNVAGAIVKDSIVPLQFPGPSMVLFQLLGILMESGKEIASIKDVLTGEQQQHNVPATTTLALIEQGLKTFTAIYKRVHRALKEELGKLYRLNGIYLAEETSYRIGDDWKKITREDYLQGSGVEPVSDPTMVSDMQRLGKAQFLMQFGQDPHFNGLEIRKRILDAAQIERPEDLLITQPPPNPMMMAKLQEMQSKVQAAQSKVSVERAQELRDMAQAILYFAQADAVAGSAHLQWVELQLDAFRAHIEAASATHGEPGGEGQASRPGLLPPPSGPPPGPSPMHPGASPLPGSPPGGAPMPGQAIAPGGAPFRPGAPPLTGAKQGRDGHYYLPDPNRAGKYLQVIH